jgi:FkbM family methyltransferase
MNTAIREILKRTKSYEDADFLSTIFGEFCDEAIRGRVPIVLFGAGSAGKELLPLLELHGAKTTCFCDNNPLLVGGKYCGLPVISASELAQKHKNSFVVITTNAFRHEVQQQLIGAGFKSERIRTISNPEAMCYYAHLAQWYWPEKDLFSNERKLLRVYERLSDQRSKDLFASRIALFVRGADYQSFLNYLSNSSDVHLTGISYFQECLTPTNNDREAYLQFNNELISLQENEVLVDGGAFTGDSTLEFIKACEKKGLKYGKVFCFEPDAKIFGELRQNVAQYKDVELLPYGLWSHHTLLRFADSDIMKAGSTKFIAASGDMKLLPQPSVAMRVIPTMTIDAQFCEEDVTFIKMDIEGAEMEALRGARKTIARCRPKLVISAYHKRDDIFEIPLLIDEITPGYKLYFRHFSTNFRETLFFGIP